MQMRCNGIRLAHEEQGTGAHVTFIHGLTVSGRVWNNQVEHLARTHRVLTYDLRGHGASDKPTDGSMSLESHLGDLSALLDQLGIQQTTLVGWSLGASIATAFAARHPGRVSRLALLGPTPMLFARPDFPHAMPADQQAALIGMAEQDFDGLMRSLGGMMLPEPHEPALNALLHGMAMQAGRDSFVATMQQVASVDLRPIIADVSVPTLVLHGSQDLLCPPPAGRYFAEHIRGAAFRLLEGAGHAALLTRPGDVSTALASFLGA